MEEKNSEEITWYDGGKLFPMAVPVSGHDVVSENVLIKRYNGIFLGHYNFTGQYWYVQDGKESASICRDGQSWRYRWEKPYLEPSAK